MPSLFSRKPIAEMVAEGEHPNALKRALGAGDLIMLAIGAVIGAGIFGAIGTAAAGQIGPNGEIIRTGAGPALVLSFLLLGFACALAGLCYAELASMIPQAGSAYAYAYATLGEIIAWIIGWDLILEYAVGNVAVAISWGDYFKSLTGGLFGAPLWITTGYRTALLSSDPAIHGLLQTAPHLAGIPILINVPAAVIVMLVTWLLMLGVRESARANNIMVAVKLVVLALFCFVGFTHIDPKNYHPFAPNGWTGIHQGAAIVFFAYIGFDAISTAAEETKNPQRNMPLGILGGLAICTIIYVIIGAVLTGMAPSSQLGVADPLARALELAGLTRLSRLLSLGAVVSMTAVLLVFQYGQPRIFFAMARDGLLPKWAAKVSGKHRVPHITTMLTGIFVAAWALIGDAGETYDLTNIGTLFAFVLVCIGVLVLRYTDPDRDRPFRVPMVWPVTIVGAGLCLYTMYGLPPQAWYRFGWWLVIGLVLYFSFGFRNSMLRRNTAAAVPDLTSTRPRERVP
ncbi:MAG TPA: amino acid permease [Gemmatimonadaceae bacterium]|jgi:APA family basic amino acid/polyamine antiporter